MRPWLRLGASLVVLGSVAWLAIAAWPEASTLGKSSPRGAEARAAELSRAMRQASAPSGSSGDASLTLQGTVVGPEGPVPGARVLASAEVEGETLSTLPCGATGELTLLECLREEAAQVREWVDGRSGEALVRAEALTEADGSFVLPGLEAGTYALWVESAEGVGFQPRVVAGSEPVELRLGVGVRVSGTVTDEAKAPVPGALVTCIFVAHSRFFETLTDAQGRFELGPLPRGPLVLIVKKEGLLPAIERFTGFKARMERNYELPRPRSLTGRVLLSKAPVAGVQVKAQGDEGHPRQAVTDAQGRFSFEEMAPTESIMLSASHVGSAAFTRAHWEKGALTTDVTVELRPAAVLEGVVRDEDGQPIVGAEVEMEWQEEEEPDGVLPGSRWTATDEEGRYRLGPEHPGRYLLRVDARGFHQLEAGEERLGAGETRRDFTLKRTLRVEGLLVDPEGRPIAGEYISLAPLEPEGTFRSDSSETGEDGRFALFAPREGAYRLSVMGGGARPLEKTVTVPSEPLRIVAERQFPIEGELVDETGAPVPVIDVVLWQETESSRMKRLDVATTDKAGRFSMHVASTGRYVATAELYSREVLRRDVQVVEVDGKETPRVRLRLATGRSLSGVVVDLQGRPVPGVPVQLLPVQRSTLRGRGGSPLQYLQTDAEGRFTFEEAPDEPLDFCFENPHHYPVGSSMADARCLRVKNEGQPLHIVLGREVFVTGRLIHADGTPVKHFSVNGQEKRRDDGEFSIRILRPGMEPILLSAPGGYTVQRIAPAFAEGEVIQDLGSIVLAP